MASIWPNPQPNLLIVSSNRVPSEHEVKIENKEIICLARVLLGYNNTTTRPAGRRRGVECTERTAHTHTHTHTH